MRGSYHHRDMTCLFFFFFNDTATTEIYTLSLHDALPISEGRCLHDYLRRAALTRSRSNSYFRGRSEEHTSELQSLAYLVCRLLLEKKKKALGALHLRHAGRASSLTRRPRRNHQDLRGRAH